MTTLETAIPAEWTVEAGRDAYLRENGFTVAAYDDPRTKVSFLGFEFSVPNTKKHRWAIMLHDLHHVATGFGTDPAGEGEISAWEVRSGVRGLGWYVATLVVMGTALGFLITPRRALRAWRMARRARSLFSSGIPYDRLLAMSVGELRETLGVPRAGLAAHPRRLHSTAPDPSKPAAA